MAARNRAAKLGLVSLSAPIQLTQVQGWTAEKGLGFRSPRTFQNHAQRR